MLDRWMGGWSDGWVDGWTEGWMMDGVNVTSPVMKFSTACRSAVVFSDSRDVLM